MPDAAEQLVVSKPLLVRFAESRPLILFFALAYLWSWTLWFGMSRVVPNSSVSGRLEILFEGFFAIAAFGPTIAALITGWLACRNLKVFALWTGWGNLIRGLVFGLGAFAFVTLVAALLAVSKAPFYAWHWSSLLHWSTYGINFSSFFGGPVNEEPGWRGFALPQLQERYGAVGATLILAALWAGWHTPLFWMQGWTSATPWEFLLILLGISFLFTAAANLSRFNVVVAIVLHAFFNTSGRLGNTLAENLPSRPHEMANYALTVLACGTAIGIVALAACGKLKKTSRTLPGR